MCGHDDFVIMIFIDVDSSSDLNWHNLIGKTLCL